MLGSKFWNGSNSWEVINKHEAGQKAVWLWTTSSGCIIYKAGNTYFAHFLPRYPMKTTRQTNQHQRFGFWHCQLHITSWLTFLGPLIGGSIQDQPPQGAHTPKHQAEADTLKTGEGVMDCLVASPSGFLILQRRKAKLREGKWFPTSSQWLSSDKDDSGLSTVSALNTLSCKYILCIDFWAKVFGFHQIAKSSMPVLDPHSLLMET
jgi:hypothetical protein